MNIKTGYPKWDAACNDLIAQVQITSQLGGEPLDYVETFRRGIAQHDRLRNYWGSLAWRVGIDNALDYDNWTAFMTATVDRLRSMSLALEI